MITIVIQDTKQFMSKLFKEEMFDNFLVHNLEIVSFVTFEIKKNTQNTTWQTLRPYALNIIKGKDTPRSIKIVFSLNPEESEKLKTETNFFMNMYFDQGDLYFTTGISSKNFSLDKTTNQIWGDYVKDFFKKNVVAFKLME